MIFGVENTPTLYSKICDYGFAKHGYKVIIFRLQDYDVEDNVMIERIKAAISSTA